jgi:hypothetical protein
LPKLHTNRNVEELDIIKQVSFTEHLTSDKVSTLEFLHFNFHTPKCQSGSNFVWPAIINEYWMLLCNPEKKKSNTTYRRLKSYNLEGLLIYFFSFLVGRRGFRIKQLISPFP